MLRDISFGVEWAEGYRPRFGLVYIDFKTQQRIIKNSGFWYSRLIQNQTFADSVINELR
jgi:beta-glucosidase